MLESQIIIDENEKLANVHPGEVLKKEFLEPMNISENRLSEAINVPQNQVDEIIEEKKPITADIAIRLSKFFGTSAEFWLNLQNLYDLEEEEKNHAEEFYKIKLYNYDYA